MIQQGHPVTLTLYALPERQSITLSPKGCRPLSEAIYNPPPSGGYNPRAGGPLTLTPKVCPKAPAAPLFYNLRRSRHHHPQPKGLSNLRTLWPIGPVHLKNLYARRAIRHLLNPTNPMNSLNPAAHHFAPFPWRWYNIGVIVRKKRTCKFSHHLGWEFRFRKEE